MSGIKAIQPSAVSFEGKNKVKKSSKKERNGFVSKLTNPVKDDFEKTYSIKAKDATSDMVFDYITDKAFKTVIAVGSVAFLAAKSRKATNGLTEAIKKNFAAGKEAIQQQNGATARKAVRTITDRIRGVMNDVKKANIERATKAEGETKTVVESIKDAILMPVEKFNEESKLSKFISKSSDRSAKILKKFGIEVDSAKTAQNIKNGLAKAGIKDGFGLADTAIAAGATTAGAIASTNVADDATKADNAELTIAAKTNKFVNNLEKHLNAVDKATNLLDTIGI